MARYTLAVNREFRTASSEQKADFINCVCFGSPAQNAEKYLKKGMLVCVRGWIRTGRYTNKSGQTVFTTDVQVERCEFAESKRAYDDRINAEELGERPVVHEADTAERSTDRREEHRPPVEDDFMKIPDNFDEDNIPFS